MPSAIDATKPVAGSPTTESVRQNFAAAKSEIELLQQTAGVGPQGPIGPIGPAGTITVNPTVITGGAGTNASVTVGGTPQAATIQFTIPRGNDGTGGGGITQTQAIDAVRQGQVRFEEATVTVAPTFPTTPNLAGAPVVGVGWTPASGTATQAYTHSDDQSNNLLSYPATIGSGDIYQIVCTVTRTSPASFRFPQLVNLFFGTGPTTPTVLIRSIPTAASGVIVTVRATGNFTHLIVQPDWGDDGAPNWNGAYWTGSFTLARIVRAVTLNSITYNVKDWPVVVRGNSEYDGGGGRASSNANANNTACGFQACETVTTATNITAFGYQALRDNTTANNNTAFGTQTLHVSNAHENSAFGFHALRENLTGTNNTAVGCETFRENRTGNHNTGCGWGAGRPLNNGSYNSAFGSWYALGSANAGSNNSAFGVYTLANASYCMNNAAFGAWALAYLRWGASDNTACGYEAGAHRPDGNYNDGTRNGNTYLGANTMAMDTGDYHDQDGDLVGPSNETVIGYWAIGHGDHTITLGNDDVTAIHSNVQTISTLSDSRVKTNIQPANLDMCLNAVKTLPVSRWAWQPIAGAHPDKNVTGFMADDVAKVFPKAITKFRTHLPVRGADGKMEMVAAPPVKPRSSKVKTAGIPPTPEEAAALAAVEPHMIPKVQEFKDLQYVQPTELLPTLWGAVQQLIAMHEELAKRLTSPEPPAPPASKQPEPEPEPKQPEPKQPAHETKKSKRW